MHIYLPIQGIKWRHKIILMLHRHVQDIQSGPKKWYPSFKFAITYVNAHQFYHFHCQNKKFMTHTIKVMPATSPLFCNRTT